MYSKPVFLHQRDGIRKIFVCCDCMYYRGWHVLIGGKSNYGKSVLLDGIITQLAKIHPSWCQLILCDFKKLEFHKYRELPHLLTDIVADKDTIYRELLDLIEEVEFRTNILLKHDCVNVKEYNKLDGIKRLPYTFLIVDELGELMESFDTAAEKRNVNSLSIRIAQRARSVGIHLILCTQRPSKEVVHPNLKANMSGIALKAASEANSKIIIDMKGAELLRNPGDMICKFGEPIYLRSNHVQHSTIKEIIEYAKEKFKPIPRKYYVQEIPSFDESQVVQEVPYTDNSDNIVSLEKKSFCLYKHEETEEAIQFCIENQKATVELLRKKFSIGAAKATKILNELEELQIIRSKPKGKGIVREVLIKSLDELNLELKIS